MRDGQDQSDMAGGVASASLGWVYDHSR